MLDIPTTGRTIPRANAWQILAGMYTGYNYSLLAKKKKKNYEGDDASVIIGVTCYKVRMFSKLL